MATQPDTDLDATAPESIGNATMQDDASLSLMLRSEQDDGSIAEMLLVLKPGDEDYPRMLAMLGPMKPGDSRLIPMA